MRPAAPRPPVTVTYTGEAEDSDDDCDVGTPSPDYGAAEAARTTHSCRGFGCVNKAILRLARAHDPARALELQKHPTSVATAGGIVVSAPCRSCGGRLVTRNRNVLASACYTLCDDCL